MHASFLRSTNHRTYLAGFLVATFYALAIGAIGYIDPAKADNIADNEQPASVSDDPGFSHVSSHQGWVTFQDDRSPNQVWVSNTSNYNNTTLNAIFRVEENCQADFTLFINNANLGDEEWTASFPEVSIRADDMTPLHMDALAYYVPGGLIFDFEGPKPLMLDMLRLGENLSIHLNAEKQKLGTLDTRFSLAGADQALERGHTRCLAIKRGFSGTLSDLSL